MTAPPSQGRTIAAAAAGLTAALAGAGYWLYGRGAEAPVIAAPDPTPIATPTATPAAAPQLPAEEGDALLRKLLGELSTTPELAGWLAAPSILQRLAAATNMVAAGASPRAMLDFVTLPGDFTVDEEVSPGAKNKAQGVDYHERDFISAQAYARYDRLTAVVTALDPEVAGRVYGRLRPYLDSAFAQIARPGERFDSVLKAAVDRLTAVPVPAGKVEVVAVGALYKYADPALEALRPVEKQLLRFGPANQATLQAWLRRFAATALAQP